MLMRWELIIIIYNFPGGYRIKEEDMKFFFFLDIFLYYDDGHYLIFTGEWEVSKPKVPAKLVVKVFWDGKRILLINYLLKISRMNAKTI